MVVWGFSQGAELLIATAEEGKQVSLIGEGVEKPDRAELHPKAALDGKDFPSTEPRRGWSRSTLLFRLEIEELAALARIDLPRA